MISKRLWIALVASLTATCALADETAVVGALAVTVPAGRQMPVGLPFDTTRAGSDDTGTVTACGPDYFESSNSRWQARAFSASATPYYVRITSGVYIGTTFRVAPTDNTSTRVYVHMDANGMTPDSTELAIDEGDTFEIVPGRTLASLFPAGTLAGGASATTADTVSVWGGSAYVVFYYNTTRSRWERDTDTASSPARDGVVISPDTGVMVRNRGATARTLFFSGRVAMETPVRLVQPGTTLVPLNIPVDSTLARLAPQQAGNSVAWAGVADSASAASSADLVQIWNGTAWDSHYYDTTLGYWRKLRDASGTDTGSTVLKAGSAIFVRRINAPAHPSDRVLYLPPAAP